MSDKPELQLMPLNLDTLIPLTKLEDISYENNVITFNRDFLFDLPLFLNEIEVGKKHQFTFCFVDNAFYHDNNKYYLDSNQIIENKLFVLKQEYLLSKQFIEYIIPEYTYIREIDKGDCKYQRMLVLNHYNIKNALALIPSLEVFYNFDENRIEIVQLRDGFYRTYYNFYLTNTELIDTLQHLK